MEKQKSSREETQSFQIGRKITIIFIILILVSAIPMFIGLIGILDQTTQSNVIYTTIISETDAQYTINLNSNSRYYITISPSDRITVGDFTGELSFFKSGEEVYHDIVRKPYDLSVGGLIFMFEPFISDTEGSYVINCSITYSDITFPFYLKMQRAAGISQITGYSGEEIFGVSIIIFITVVVILIIVSFIGRIIYIRRNWGLIDKPEHPQSDFVWKSKKKDENS